MASNHEQCEAVSGSRSVRIPLTVAVEGNIGSGKSTFLDFCKRQVGFSVYAEPVEQWQDVDGVNLLSNFYVNPRRWAMAFQLQVGESLLDIYNRGTWQSIKVIERSLLSSRYLSYCFMESMRRRNVLDGTSAYILNKWYNRVLDDVQAKPHVIGEHNSAVLYNKYMFKLIEVKDFVSNI